MNLLKSEAREREETNKKAMQGAYSSMMQMPAWKDLERYAESERERSINSVDSKSAGDLTIGFVCEERGIRKGILKIIQHAEQRREGI